MFRIVIIYEFIIKLLLELILDDADDDDDDDDDDKDDDDYDDYDVFSSSQRISNALRTRGMGEQ